MTNTTFRAAPWADVLFAMDLAWWRQYAKEVKRTFTGAWHSTCGACSEFGIVPVSVDGKTIKPHGNSGAGAIMTAFYAGAARIVLLGYDCQHTGGAKHWHGDHPERLGNANRPEMWARGFVNVKNDVIGVEIINASRVTALDMFNRMSIEDALCCPSS